jgi:hypothetical protein
VVGVSLVWLVCHCSVVGVSVGGGGWVGVVGVGLLCCRGGSLVLAWCHCSVVGVSL